MAHDFPGVKVVPWQFCTPPKTPAPPPVPDMTCGTWLTFFTVICCSVVVEPTGTNPKASDVGVIRKGWPLAWAAGAITSQAPR